VKTKKLLEKLTKFISADHRAQMQDIKSIKNVLKELKNKENKFKEKLKEEKDQIKHDEIKIKLNVIYAQRKKGVALLKELHEE
jgi:hypothetical protein